VTTAPLTGVATAKSPHRETMGPSVQELCELKLQGALDPPLGAPLHPEPSQGLVQPSVDTRDAPLGGPEVPLPGGVPAPSRRGIAQQAPSGVELLPATLGVRILGVPSGTKGALEPLPGSLDLLSCRVASHP